MNRIFSLRFYRPLRSDWLSYKSYLIGRLLGYNMDLSHVAIEWDGGIVGITLYGIELYSKEAEAEYRMPDVILYFECTDADIKRMYAVTTIFILSKMRLKLTQFLKFITKRKMANSFICTDFVEVIGFNPKEPTMSLTPVELLKKYASKSKMMYVSDYGRKVIENESIQVSFIVPEMWEQGQSSSI